MCSFAPGCSGTPSSYRCQLRLRRRFSVRTWGSSRTSSCPPWPSSSSLFVSSSDATFRSEGRLVGALLDWYPFVIPGALCLHGSNGLLLGAIYLCCWGHSIGTISRTWYEILNCAWSIAEIWCGRSIGMIWRMNPFMMPHTFCVGKPFAPPSFQWRWAPINHLHKYSPDLLYHPICLDHYWLLHMFQLCNDSVILLAISSRRDF